MIEKERKMEPETLISSDGLTEKDKKLISAVKKLQSSGHDPKLIEIEQEQFINDLAKLGKLKYGQKRKEAASSRTASKRSQSTRRLFTAISEQFYHNKKRT